MRGSEGAIGVTGEASEGGVRLGCKGSEGERAVDPRGEACAGAMSLQGAERWVRGWRDLEDGLGVGGGVWEGKGRCRAHVGLSRRS